MCIRYECYRETITKTCTKYFRLINYTFLTVMITGFLSLIIIGPAGYKIGDGITYILNTVYEVAGPIAGFIFGGLYSTIVLTGLHHSFHAIEAGLLANKEIGVNFYSRYGQWPMLHKVEQP
ncbi:PTS transporter subunit EIIC [Bacillus cereus]